MAKRAPFTLVVTQAAKAELEALPVFQHRRVSDAIEANLLHEPTSASRKRKSLGELATSFEYDPPLWELKVGEFRVCYDVDDAARVVYIRAVRSKPPEKTTQEVVQ